MIARTERAELQQGACPLTIALPSLGPRVSIVKQEHPRECFRESRTDLCVSQTRVDELTEFRAKDETDAAIA